MAHFFILGDFIKKEFTEEAMRKIIAEIIERVHREKQERFEFYKDEMQVAENILIETFDRKQRKLYKKFCKKRELFYEIADRIFTNMYKLEEKRDEWLYGKKD